MLCKNIKCGTWRFHNFKLKANSNSLERLVHDKASQVDLQDDDANKGMVGEKANK